MTIQKLDLRVVSEFTDTPGPRKRSEGTFSGEEFLQSCLGPRFQNALDQRVVLCVNLDGAAGYPTSFLEEAFGGLARKFGAKVVEASLEIISNDEPYLNEDIKRFVREAKRQK